MHSITIFLFIIFSAILSTLSSNGVVSVTANVRGKKFVVNACKVDDFVQQIENIAGLDFGKQSVLFRGKILSKTQSLEDLQIKSEECLNVFKNRPKPQLKNKIDPIMGEDTEKMQKAIEEWLTSGRMEETFADDENIERIRLELLKVMDKIPPEYKEKVQSIAADPLEWKNAIVQFKQQMESLKKMSTHGK